VPFWRPRGCVLWLDFLEPKGDTAYDKSGYDNHGTIYGAARVRALGRYGLEFDGVDDYVELPIIKAPAETNCFTLEALIKTTDERPDVWIVTGAHEATLADYILGIGYGRLKLFCRAYDVAWQHSTYFIADEKWHHVVGSICSGIAPQMWVDGKLVWEGPVRTFDLIEPTSPAGVERAPTILINILAE